MRRMILLAAVSGAFAFSAMATFGCAACGERSTLAAAGTAAYAVLLAATLWQGNHPLVRVALLASSGFHLGLVSVMAGRGAVCGLCIACAACCFTATAVALWGDRARWGLVPAVMPWTAGLALALPQPEFPPLEPSERLRITVYEQADCPYCDLLKHRVMPEAMRGLSAVEVAYTPADGVAFVSRTPTLVITRGSARRILEGLPSPAELRAEVLALQGGMP
ncbi:MAG: hypothetical protein HY716_17540 [Planctomycetes bacterium]|nr:hypothetical protein [Planctomycetota bacterium]